jgi:hypothetical protein
MPEFNTSFGPQHSFIDIILATTLLSTMQVNTISELTSPHNYILERKEDTVGNSCVLDVTEYKYV